MPGLEPSAWVTRWSRLIEPRGSVLDVACGSGRHLRWLAAQGFAVTGVDRDAAALAPLGGLGRTIAADIETGPWPLAGERFDAVVVTNYLWRPLWPALLASAGRRRRPDLRDLCARQRGCRQALEPRLSAAPGELLEACRGLRVVAFEDGLLDAPLRRVQRIVAVKAPAVDARHLL